MAPARAADLQIVLERCRALRELELCWNSESALWFSSEPEKNSTRLGRAGAALERARPCYGVVLVHRRNARWNARTSEKRVRHNAPWPTPDQRKVFRFSSFCDVPSSSLRLVAPLLVALASRSAQAEDGLVLATEPGAPTPPPAWRDARRWGYELRVSPSVGIEELRDGTVLASVGAAISGGFRWNFELGPWDWLMPAILGSEAGVDLRLAFEQRVWSSRDTPPPDLVERGGTVVSLGVEGVGRGSWPDSRLRFVSVLSLLAPGVGVTIDMGAAEQPARVGVYATSQVFPVGILLDEHVGLEISPTVQLRVDLGGLEVSTVSTLTTALVFR
jgi:hypothetical protein